MQNDDFFNGVPVPKGETRFDDSKILDVIGIFDKYNDLYQQIKMNDINNDDSIDELFMVSMLFRWIDSSITDDDINHYIYQRFQLHLIFYYHQI